MNAGELKTALSNVPDDMPVLVASDPEGNGFRTLQDAEVASIPLNDDKHGYTEGVLHPDDAAEYDADELEDRLVLWP